MTTTDFDKKVRRAHWILSAARNVAAKQDAKFGTQSVSNRVEEFQVYDDEENAYSEPGYCADVVATGNWNSVNTYTKVPGRESISDLPRRVQDLLEKIDVEIEWSDEWTSCGECGKLVRTSPDSYSWTASFSRNDDDGYCTCHECLAEDPESHLESLEGDDRACNTISTIDPADHGYVLVNADSYETGWHPGQNDNPKTIAIGLKNRGIDRFLFQLDESSQFYSKWSVYVHEDEKHLLSDNATDDEEDDREEDDNG